MMTCLVASTTATGTMRVDPSSNVPGLAATPSQITDGNGQRITLSWQNDFVALDGDRIFVSCGKKSAIDDHLEKQGEILINSTSPIRSIQTASLINMRCNYSFAYARQSNGSSHITVLEELIVPLAPGLAKSPAQGHLAFADKTNEMWVLWVSSSKKVPTVHYSTSPGTATIAASLTTTVLSSITINTTTGTSGTYHASDMCSAPANQTGQQLFIDPGYMHRVLLKGLKADTDYYYTFG